MKYRTTVQKRNCRFREEWMKNFRTFGMVGALLLMVVCAVAIDVDWVALNPAYEGASKLNDSEICFACHEGKDAFDQTTHAKVTEAAKAAAGENAATDKTLAAGACESCHGPRSLHVDDPDRALELKPDQQNTVCLQCHKDGDRMNWAGSQHASAGITCTSCHTVMQKKNDKSLLAADHEEDVCYTCHADVRGQMNKTSHHPVREGKIVCSDCHNPHGSTTSAMLRGASVTETCYQCHQEKRGPFIWVHPPAQENCLTCHDSHGSNKRKLLNGKDSFLCMSCHTYGGHVNLPRYNRVSNPYGEGCVNCHIAVHGSNSPSGAKLTR